MFKAADISTVATRPPKPGQTCTCKTWRNRFTHLGMLVMADDSSAVVPYVVVVHGMGNARENETVLGVVSRVADARSRRGWPEPPDIVTLAAASGQTGYPHAGPRSA